MSSLTPSTSRATFAVGGEVRAKEIVDRLTESFDDGQAAVTAFEAADGIWSVALHFAEPPEPAVIRALVAVVGDDDLAAAVAFDRVEAQDWVKASLDALAPVHAGRFIVHGQHDRAKIPPNRIGLEIEAALAFGTGHHGTTRGCLLLLDLVLRRLSPRRLLDLGSGTGVLAIAAAKALHAGVLASDIDPQAVMVARDNARLNGVGHLVYTICATGFAAEQFRAAGPFDLVLANILANPLRELAAPMAAHLAPKATVILSGLLPAQAPSVIAAYRARDILLKRHLIVEGWSSLLLQRR
jgi:ribosomal protein L11 methyltransferase